MAKRSGRMRHSALSAEIDDFIALMRSVPGVDGLRTAFAETIDSYSFRTFVYGGMHLPQLDDNATPYILTTFPDDWQRRYFERQHHQSDPVILESLRSVVPLKW